MESNKIVGIIHNGFKDGVYTDSVIRRNYTPSYWTHDDERVIPIFRIHMSCGGGMGGSSWYEYIRKDNMDMSTLVNELNQTKFITVQRYMDDSTKILSTNFIVDIEEYDVHIKTFMSNNPNYKSGCYEVHTLTKVGHRILDYV